MIRALALVLLVGAVVLTSWRWGSFVAGGSDSSCYAIQAVRWSQVLAHPLTASMQTPDPLALAAPWPDAASTFAPTGHVASRTVPGAFVPICSGRTFDAMAPLYLAGGAPLMFAIVPFCRRGAHPGDLSAGVTLQSAHRHGRRIADGGQSGVSCIRSCSR